MPVADAAERIVAVIPTYNEAANVERVIARVRAAVPEAHVLIVDDQSPDGTAALVREQPGFDTEVHLLSRDGERGLGNAYRAGFAWAAARDYTVVLQLDADLSHPPESLPALIEAVSGPDAADIAIGSRYVAGGGTEGWPLRRQLISRAAGTYVRAVLRLPVGDPTAGFKAYRATTLKAIDVATTTTSGYGFQVECLWRAHRAGLRIVELPITFVDRVAGSSKMTFGVATEAARKVLSWRIESLRHPIAITAAVTALLAFALHLFYLRGSLLSDEGGFTMVARWWGNEGGHLYGAQWVDRPPGLISIFWLADHLGAHGPRLIAGLFAAGFVLAAAWAGWAVRGARAARWSMIAAFFLVITPVTQTFALNGELIASTWTMIAVAAAITLVRDPSWSPRAVGCALLAGLGAGASVMTKQNFLDAAAFVAVLGIGHLVVNKEARGRLLALAGVAILGFAIPLGATALWAATHTGISDLIYAMYGFRIDAAQVMSEGSLASAHARRTDLIGIAIGSGVITIGLPLLVAGSRRLRRPSPLLFAVLAALAVELVGVVFGGNYWPHYLIGLSPMIALAAGVLAPEPGHAPRMARTQIVLAVVVAVVMTPLAGQVAAQTSSITKVGRWMVDASRSTDTVVALYSHANVVGATGLRPTYPYAWSLPVRTRDPQLTELYSTLTDPATAPTWVIGWDPLNQWKLDGDHRIEGVLATRYVRAATICKHPIWLLRGVDRTIPPDPCDPARHYATGA